MQSIPNSEQGAVSAPPVRFLSRSELRTVKGINFSHATLYRKISDSTFPRPVKVSPSKNGWLEPELDAWAAARIAERDSAPKGEA
jgi:prophage regulatory protein